MPAAHPPAGQPAAPPRRRSRGTPFTLDRDQERARGLRGPTPRRRDGAEQQREGALVVGDHQRSGRAARPGGPRAPRPRRSCGSPRTPATRSASKARSATPDSMIAIVSASSSRFWLTKPPCLHPLQRHRLDRGRLLVRVEADLAKEDAVRPRDRLVAEAIAWGPEKRSDEPREALLDLLAGSAPSRARSAGSAARAPETPRRAPARPSRASAPPRRSSAAPRRPARRDSEQRHVALDAGAQARLGRRRESSAMPAFAKSRIPPGYANATVGHPPTR